MKIHRDIEQGSVEWHNLRAGVITASEMDRLVSPLGIVRKGAGPDTYLDEKLEETWYGGPSAEAFGSFDMEQGKLVEEIARPFFTLHTGYQVEQVGFISSDDKRTGCSPDGLLIGRNEGLEIKCPRGKTQIGYLRSGKVPSDYVVQVQASLWVTGYEAWWFMSYRRGLPPLVLRVEPDEAIQKAISQAVAGFTAAFDAELARLTELNGGPPKHRGLKPFPKLKDDGRFDILN